MSRLSKRNGRSFGTRKRAEGHTTNCAANAGTSVSRVLEQLLYVVQNITPKEVLKQHLKATNSTIRVKAKNYTRLNLKRRIKRKSSIHKVKFLMNTRFGASDGT